MCVATKYPCSNKYSIFENGLWGELLSGLTIKREYRGDSNFFFCNKTTDGEIYQNSLGLNHKKQKHFYV